MNLFSMLLEGEWPQIPTPPLRRLGNAWTVFSITRTFWTTKLFFAFVANNIFATKLWQMFYYVPLTVLFRSL